MTQNIMCAACAFKQQRDSFSFLSCNSAQEKTFQGHSFCMTKCSLITVISQIWVVFSAGKWECVFNNLDRASAFEAWQTDFSAPSHSS